MILFDIPLKESHPFNCSIFLGFIFDVFPPNPSPYSIWSIRVQNQPLSYIYTSSVNHLRQSHFLSLRKRILLVISSKEVFPPKESGHITTLVLVQSEKLYSFFSFLQIQRGNFDSFSNHKKLITRDSARDSFSLFLPHPLLYHRGIIYQSCIKITQYLAIRLSGNEFKQYLPKSCLSNVHNQIIIVMIH